MIGAYAIGIYGSFATGDENEYSDLDLLVITSSRENEKHIVSKVHNYLISKINIPIDIKVVYKENIKETLTIAMENTLKIIWEEENE